MGVLTDQILALQVPAKPLQLAAWFMPQYKSCTNWLFVMVSLPTPYGHLFSQNRAPYPQNLHGTIRPNCISKMVSILMPPLPTVPFPTKQAYWPLRQVLGLQIAAKLLQIVTWWVLTAYRNLPMLCPMVESPIPCWHLFSQKMGSDTPKQIACCWAVWLAILVTAGLLVITWYCYAKWTELNYVWTQFS